MSTVVVSSAGAYGWPVRALAALAMAVVAARPVPDEDKPVAQPVSHAEGAVPDTDAVPDTALTTGARGDVTTGARGDVPGNPRSGAVGRDDAMDRRREAIASEILRIGASLQHALAAGNVAAIMARVPATGLRCGERVIPRARVDRDLRTRGSWLHEVLFGEAGSSPRAPRSLRSFLNVVPDAKIVVWFRRDPTIGPVGRPCLDYRGEGFTTPGSPLCFERRNGAWWFVDSLYPCS